MDSLIVRGGGKWGTKATTLPEGKYPITSTKFKVVRRESQKEAGKIMAHIIVDIGEVEKVWLRATFFDAEPNSKVTEGEFDIASNEELFLVVKLNKEKSMTAFVQAIPKEED